MAITIILVSRSLSPSEAVYDRLRACYESIKFFDKGLFYPREIEVWFDATSEALEGILSRVFPINNLLEDTKTVSKYLDSMKTVDKLRTIIVFRGTWVIQDYKLAGYFSVHNKTEWINTYGDIEISAYPKGEVEDFIDLLWSMDEIQGLVTKFIHDFYGGIQSLKVGVSIIAFTRGLWSKEDLSNTMALYLAGGRRSLLKLFYDVLRDRKESDIYFKSKPLNTKFLIDTLLESEIVDLRVKRRLCQNTIAELPAKSSIYLAKEQKSFQKLFEELTEAVLKPAFKELPRDKAVKERIYDGLKTFKGE